jgi:hypothetical protein
MDDQTYEAINGVFEEMDEHHPTAAHWYLPLTRVDPIAQGRRLGCTLLQHALAICDGLPAYLEATSPRSPTSTRATDSTSSGSSRPGHHHRWGRCSESPRPRTAVRPLLLSMKAVGLRGAVRGVQHHSVTSGRAPRE